MKAKHCCIEILNLLRQVGATEWCKPFEYLITLYDSHDLKRFFSEVKKIYAGSNSFNDLVLYKNDNLCFEENETLDNLRHKLYQEFIKYKLIES